MSGLDLMRFTLFFAVFLVGSSSIASPNNFAQAKKIAADIFSQHQLTLYCNCGYEQKKVKLASCGMNEASNHKRAHRLEWEHHGGRTFRATF